MISAYSTTQSTLAFHGNNHFNWVMQINGDGSSGGGGGGGGGGGSGHKLTIEQAIDYHGILMWFSWSILGLIQIVSQRYFKHMFKVNRYVHIVSGTLLAITVSTAFTLVFSVVFNKTLDLTLWHTRFGFFTFCGGLCVALGGILGESSRRLWKNGWGSSNSLLVGKFHKIFGYVILAVS
jgi:hypothetical protein